MFGITSESVLVGTSVEVLSASRVRLAEILSCTLRTITSCDLTLLLSDETESCAARREFRVCLPRIGGLSDVPCRLDGSTGSRCSVFLLG